VQSNAIFGQETNMSIQAITKSSPSHSAGAADTLAAGRLNDRIGTELHLETDSMRIWHLRLKPGQRIPYHRHDRPYFWSVTTDGKGRSHFDDGRVVDIDYKKGESKYFNDLSVENMFVHDLTNIGDSELVFVTVEFNR
jgi:quercetin dioxygenase-like cupin family protein